MTILEANISTHDLTSAWKGPVPFLDAKKREVGKVVSIRWDGRFTVGTIQLNPGEKMPDCAEVTAELFK